MHQQIERDVMRTHPDMHFFSGSDGAAVTHRKVRVLILVDVCGTDKILRHHEAWFGRHDAALETDTGS